MIIRQHGLRVSSWQGVQHKTVIQAEMSAPLEWETTAANLLYELQWQASRCDPGGALLLKIIGAASQYCPTTLVAVCHSKR